MKLKLSEIVSAAGGTLLSGDPETAIAGFFTDSRMAKPGLMFVPIRGERTDGHRYIASAFALGAAASFTEEPETPSDGPLVLVEDARLALQKTAARYRDRFELPVVGITGSVGKTTAKEMVATALSARYTVHKTAGNQNSQIGVPMTLFGLTPRHTAAVIEMGVSMPGEMERIARTVRPTLAVITNIGSAHLEFMKTRETTLREKSHIADHLPADGAVFVNGDDPLLREYAQDPAKKAVTFGLDPRCDWRASALREADGGTFFTCEGPGERCELFVPAMGEHNVRNALCAMAVARRLSVPAEDVKRALSAYRAPAGRQQLKRFSDLTVIDDSYNASPDSVATALKVLASREVTGKRVAVLADMLELGDYEQAGHFETGACAKSLGIDLLVAAGPLSKETARGFGEGAEWFPNNEAAAAFLLSRLSPGDAVLIKGSHGMHTEALVEALRAHFGEKAGEPHA